MGSLRRSVATENLHLLPDDLPSEISISLVITYVPSSHTASAQPTTRPMKLSYSLDPLRNLNWLRNHILESVVPTDIRNGSEVEGKPPAQIIFRDEDGDTLDDLASPVYDMGIKEGSVLNLMVVLP
jgi:hypothetical protein